MPFPPFLCIDEEGGEVSRLSNHAAFGLPQYKNAASIPDVPAASEMGGIANDYASGKAAIMALQAGCHIILVPEDFREAFRAVLEAVSSGQLSESWLDETVGKIILFKQNRNLLPRD